MSVCLLITAAIVASPVTHYMETGWNHTIIDSSGDVQFASLSFDEWNLPHIAYQRGNSIWYAHRAAGEWTWSTEEVGPGEEPTIATMPGGDPVILYSSAQTQLTLASKEGEEWSYETYTDIDRWLTDPVLAISPDGTKHMIYFNWMYAERHELRYAWNDGTGWSRTEIESNYGDNVTSYEPSLTLSPGGYPRVSAVKVYIDDLDDAYFLKLYAKTESGYWQTSDIASGSCRGRPGISAISDSLTALCYYWNSPEGIRYVEYPGGQTSTIYQGNNYFPDLATDSQGNPHIVFLDSATLVYLTDEGALPFPEFSNTWHSVDIEIDQYDQPHIAFNDDDNLNYLWYGDPEGIGESSECTGTLISSISPSPAAAQTVLTLNPSFQGTAEISVFDLAGRTVLHTQTGEITTSLDLSTMAPGVYCVRAKSGDSTDSRLITVMR